MTLAEDLLLLAIDPRLHIVRERRKVGYGLMAADLAELAVARRVEASGRWPRRILVIDPTPTGDDLLDVALASLREARPPAGLDTWVEQVRPYVLEQYLGRLAARGAVQQYWMRLSSQLTLLEGALLDSGREAQRQVRTRVDRFAVDGAPADTLDWALAGLAYECNLIYMGRHAARPLGDRGKRATDPVEATIWQAMRKVRLGDTSGPS